MNYQRIQVCSEEFFNFITTNKLYLEKLKDEDTGDYRGYFYILPLVDGHIEVICTLIYSYKNPKDLLGIEIKYRDGNEILSINLNSPYGTISIFEYSIIGWRLNYINPQFVEDTLCDSLINYIEQNNEQSN